MKYLNRTTELVDIVYDMRKLENYNVSSYPETLSKLNLFMMMYYKSMYKKEYYQKYADLIVDLCFSIRITL